MFRTGSSAQFKKLVDRQYKISVNGNWKNGRADLKFTDRQFDTIAIRWKPDDGSLGSEGEELLLHRGLKNVVFDTVQAGLEACATVSRVPGTPAHPAVISDIDLYTDGAGDSTMIVPAQFENEHLQIVVLAPKGTDGSEGWEDIHLDNTKGDINPARGEMQYLHYNIKLNGHNSVSLWDKYEWWDDARKKAKTRGFDWTR